MAEASIFHGSRDDIHVLRFIGEARYMLAPAVMRLLDGLFKGQQPPQGFLVDLTEATAIDSTCLGVLAQISNAMTERGASRVTLLVNSEDIILTLMSVGFDEEFDIVQGDVQVTAGEAPLPVEAVDKRTLNQTILDAHRCLMDLSEHNAEVFRDVVHLLEKDLK